VAEYVDAALRPEVTHLRKRYPGVRIVSARLDCEYDKAGRAYCQSIRYQAPRETLVRHGLLTATMLLRKDMGLWHSVTDLRDSFFVCEYLDHESRRGCVDLVIHTRSVPCERKVGTYLARPILNRIARESLRTKT
jgi:hypothetical protein